MRKPNLAVCTTIIISLALMGCALPDSADSNFRGRKPQPPSSQDCIDTPVADPTKSSPNEFPVHDRITAYLSSSELEHASFSCQSPEFVYEGRRSNERIEVVSRYGKSKKVHTALVYESGHNIGGFRKHGMVRVFAPDGALQSLQYYWNGFPVGLHRYFDEKGGLRAVVDYSKSDYRLERNRKGGHSFTRNGSTLANGVLRGEATLFREVYVIEGDQARRVRFHAAPLFGSWDEMDSQSTVEQWTKPGDQGSVLLFSSTEPWNLHNLPLEYTQFAEIYQRKRKGLPGIAPVEKYNAEILAADWIDDAMALAIEDRRFSFPEVKAVTELERMADPRARYIACLQKPTVDCLLAFALEHAVLEESHSETFLRGTAVAAVATRRPQYALAAVDKIMEGPRRGSYRMPNPLFAQISALKAQAELLAGDKTAAEKSLDETFLNATTRQSGYENRNGTAILLSMPTLAREGRLDQARKAYDVAVAERAPLAHELLAEVGLGYARAGRVDEALRVVKELQQPLDAGASLPENRPGGEKLANAMRAMTGNPFASNSRKQAYLLARAGVAQGMAQRGDMGVAKLLLSEVETQIKNEASTSSTTDMIQSEIAQTHALLGNAERVRSILETVRYHALPAWTQSAANLCGTNRQQDGLGLLERATSLSTHLSAGEYAAIGLGFARCKEAEKARKFFLLARDTADKTPDCSGDMCGGFKGEAQTRVVDKIIQAGMFDLVKDWPASGLNDDRALSLALALAQFGEMGDAVQRLAELEKKHEGKPEPRWQAEIALAKAEILMLKNEREQAIKQFNVALRNAKATSDSNGRALALARVAQAQTRSGLCTAAQATLRDARTAADRTRMSGAPGIYHDNAQAIVVVIAHDFARCGFDADAEISSTALLRDAAASVGRDHIAGLSAERVMAEIAVASATKNVSEALGLLADLSPSEAKLHAAMRIEALESRRSLPDRLRIAKKFLEQEKGKAADYFLTAQGDLERRILIGNFSELMRREKTSKSPGDDELIALLMDESNRIQSINWRARALCDLGYTAQVIGRDEDSRRLFEQGLATAKTHSTRTFPLDPPPSGACGFWLKRAGDNARAQAAADQPIQWMRSNIKPGFVREADTGTLLGLAISYAEAEIGEIQVDWSRLIWN